MDQCMFLPTVPGGGTVGLQMDFFSSSSFTPPEWGTANTTCPCGEGEGGIHPTPTTVLCTVLYCTVLYCTVLYCTVLYCTVLYCTVLYCIVLYSTVLFLKKSPPQKKNYKKNHPPPLPKKMSKIKGG